jgi:hypothetical protein
MSTSHCGGELDFGLTVVLDLLIVLDRLRNFNEYDSISNMH